MEPLTMGMAGAAAANVGSQILGGILGSKGGISQGDMVIPSFDAYSDLGMSSSLFDALNQLGFGNINNVASPLEQFVNRINGLSVDERTKRRALTGLQPVFDQFNQGVADPFSSSNQGFKRGRLKNVLSKMGMSLDDISGIFKENQAHEQKAQRLRDAGLDGMQIDTILNRAQAAQSASQLLGDAGRYATGGDPNSFQTGLLDRINRGINDQEQQFLLRAQYGGFNPAAGLQGIRDMRQDSDLTALTQAVQMASALTGGLSTGQQVAQNSSTQNSGQSLGALGIAAGQAQAANQLAQQSSMNKWDSIANGVGGAGNALSQGMMFSALMGGGAKPGMSQKMTPLGGVGTEQGFNFNFNQPAGLGLGNRINFMGQ